jgi:hypothetical protein
MGYVVKARYWHHPHTLQVEMIRFDVKAGDEWHQRLARLQAI